MVPNTVITEGYGLFHNGFTMTFPNNLTISVRWGDGNYCENRYTDKHFAYSRELNIYNALNSVDAEVMIVDNKTGYCVTHHFTDLKYDDVVGWLDPITVARIIHDVSVWNRKVDKELTKRKEYSSEEEA